MKKVDSVKGESKDLDQIVWAAGDILRASVTSDKATLFVVVLLVVKFFEDLSRDRSEGKAKKWGRVWTDLKMPAGCNWDRLCEQVWSRRAGVALDDFLREVERLNSEFLEGAFDGVKFEDLGQYSPSGVLAAVLQVISEADLRPSRFENVEELAKSFEGLFFMLAEREGSRGVEFHVPPALAALLANLLDPLPGESILDPVCGSGSLMSRLARQAGPEHGSIWGQDWRSSALSLCKLRLLLQGVTFSQVELADPLRVPLRGSSGRLLKAHVVAGNPPFGLRDWGGESVCYNRPELRKYGLSPKSASEFAFLCHMIEAAHDKDGRVGIIVPHGILFREGERELRRYLIESNLLSGIVALPPKMFYSTAIPVAVLLLDKRKKVADVMFVDASRSYEADGRLNRLPSSAIERISGVLRSRESLSGFSRCVQPEEIIEQDFQLMVTRYVFGSEEKASQRSIEELTSEVDRAQSELAAVESEVNRILKALGVNIS